MGGWGSGSSFRCGSRRKAESSLPLDIRYFKRKGLLEPGSLITSSWSIGGNVYSSIQGRVFEDHLLLMYRHKKTEDIKQRINFTWTNCNYGGERIWFICPDCGRRCAVIYSRGKYFACRKCCNLLYNSQCQTLRDRRFSKANKLRETIGAEIGSSHPLPIFKPLNMHQKTWDRIRHQIERLENQGWSAMGRMKGY
ncbi:MAG: hypothetical protein HQK62_13665 [Desulfamplus sp.]|nr:hypothetical protein [Desulfamplus sp.]